MTHLLTETLLWVKTLVVVAVAAGLLPWLYRKIELAQAELKTQKVTTKTKNLSLALEFAKGAVGLAEKISGSGESQETSAILALKQRLQENNLSSLFTDTQLKQIVQQAYAALKTDGSIDALKVSEKEEKTK